jgi:hypothetical protein
VADFKVIIKKHDGTENDEHTYWGSVFIMPNHVQTKELSNFTASEGTVSAEFSFPQDIIPVGKQFVACVYGYDNEDENLNIAECKIGENHKEREPELIDFPHTP